jgi:hypothetical protein
MHQADKPKEVSPLQADEFESLISQCPEEFQKTVREYMQKQLKIENVIDLPLKQYTLLKNRVLECLEENKKTGTENA